MFERIKKLFAPKSEPKGWVSWYETPISRHKAWLKPDCCDGWLYTPYRHEAHVFPTREEALKVTPVYDGGEDVSTRTGVEPA